LARTLGIHRSLCMNLDRANEYQIPKTTKAWGARQPRGNQGWSRSRRLSPTPPMSSCATTPRSSDPRRTRERDVPRGGADCAEALRREKMIHATPSSSRRPSVMPATRSTTRSMSSWRCACPKSCTARPGHPWLGRAGSLRAKLLSALKICVLEPNIIHKALLFGGTWGTRFLTMIFAW